MFVGLKSLSKIRCLYRERENENGDENQCKIWKEYKLRDECVKNPNPSYNIWMRRERWSIDPIREKLHKYQVEIAEIASY